jgi:hypothetical protein
MPRKFSKVAKDKKTGLPKKYLEGASNRSAKAKEIKKTAAAYKAGKKIDIKAVSKSRAAQGKKNAKSKTTKRSR